MGYLDHALSEGTGPAPNRLYAVLVALVGLATLAVGILWLTEKPPAAPTPEQEEILRLFPDARPVDSGGLGSAFATMLAVTAVLLVSWWAARKRQGIRRPATSRGAHRRGRRDDGGPIG